MAVKYKIEFASNNGTNYRVDIYDPNYSGSVIPLQGGATPLTTEEDNSDDFFAPIRTSTGALKIINGEDTDSFLPVDVIEDLCPKTNTERFVELWKVGTSREDIVWQGYISCEAYTQAFTDQVREITINCNSVLQAMDSKRVSPKGVYAIEGLMTIRQIIYNMLHDSGIYNLVWNADDEGIFDMKLDTSVCYEVKELVNGYNIKHEVIGLSVKEVLTRIATYMGWCIRESGDTMFINRIGAEPNMKRATLEDFANDRNATEESDSIIILDNFDWMGSEHSITLMQGAKLVEINEELADYSLDIGLPECPRGDLSGKYSIGAADATDRYTMETYQNENIDFADNIICRAYKGVLSPWQLIPGYASTYGTIVDRITPMSPNDMAEDAMYSIGTMATVFDIRNDITEYYTLNCGAFIGLNGFKKESDEYNEFREGLYLQFLPFCVARELHPAHTIQVDPIFSINSILTFRPQTGYIKVDINFDGVLNSSGSTSYVEKSKGNKQVDRLTLGLRCGNMYWSGSSWTSSPYATFNVALDNGKLENNWDTHMGIEETDGHLIPVTSDLFGTVELMIYPYAGLTINDEFDTFRTVEIFCDRIEVGYIPKEDIVLSSRNSNKYISIINKGFSDEKVVDTNIATCYYNNTSPSLVMVDEQTAMTSLLIGSVKTTPERDLLNRMATHYGAAKRKLTLQVEHPTEPLPLLRVTDGTGSDEKTYIPVAESRDYAADTSELTLLEI